MDLELSGKKAIVTGGGRGIGKWITELLAEEGASVAICGRNPDTLEGTLEGSSAAGLNVLGRPVDVGDPLAYRDWMDWAVGELRGLDIFVHNVTSGVESGTLEDWEHAHRVDMMGAVIACEHLQPELEKSNAASIIFISSISALLTRTGKRTEHAYGAMKAALLNYATQLSKLLGPKGVRVNVVSPGAIDFPDGVWDLVRRSDPDYYNEVSRAAAIGRMGRPEEIAYAVAMLASPRASLITGSNLIVDGGFRTHVDF